MWGEAGLDNKTPMHMKSDNLDLRCEKQNTIGLAYQLPAPAFDYSIYIETWATLPFVLVSFMGDGKVGPTQNPEETGAYHPWSDLHIPACLNSQLPATLLQPRYLYMYIPQHLALW